MLASGSSRKRPNPSSAGFAQATRQRVVLKPPDALLLGAVAFLLTLGLVMVFSASSVTAYTYYHDNAYYLKHQLGYVAIGLVVSYAVYRVDYRKLKQLAPSAVVLAMVLLLLTLIPHVGFATGGARRWLGFHAISFQPSEFAKLALVLFLAAKLAQLGEGVRSLSRGVVLIFFVTLLVALPVFFEPDMGTASLMIFTAFAMLFTAGARIEHLVLSALAMLPAVLLAVGSSAYKRARLGLHQPLERRAEHRLPHRAVAARPRQRWNPRPGPGRVAAKVFLSAGGAHRLHLRRARRRARHAGRAGRHRALRALRDSRRQSRRQGARPVRDAARDGLHVSHRDPGVHQHRRRDWLVAGDRRSAAVHLVRRDLAHRLPDRRCPHRQR